MRKARQCYVLGAVLAGMAVILLTRFGLYFPALIGVILSTLAVSYAASQVLISPAGLAPPRVWVAAGVVVPALSVVLLIAGANVVLRMLGKLPVLSGLTAVVGMMLGVPVGVVGTLLIRSYIEKQIYGSKTLR